MWWIKALVLLLMAGAVIALFRALAAMMRGDSSDGRMVRALGWRVGLSAAVFLLLLLSVQMGWIKPNDSPLRQTMPTAEDAGPAAAGEGR